MFTFKDLLVHHEGLRLKPYKDTKGFWTIGVGRNLDGKGLTAEEKQYLGIPPRDIMDGVTNDEAFYLLDNDIKAVIVQVRETFSWFDDLSNVRQAIICDLVFNMGLMKLLGFKHMLGAIPDAIQSDDWTEVVNQMKNSGWYIQTGVRAREDAQMMETGEPLELRTI